MIKRGLALIVAVFAMVQLAGGTLPAEAEEPAAMYETVTRADGGVAELVKTDARRTMTVRTPEGNETTTVECEDGSITTISSENGCTRIAVSLSQSACEAAKMAPFVLPIAPPALDEAGGTRLTLELPQGGDVFLALPLEDTDDGVRVFDLAEEAEPLVMPVENDQVVLSLSDGETVVLARA